MDKGKKVMRGISNLLPEGIEVDNLVWSYGRLGLDISAIVAAVGTMVTNLLGGWDTALPTLCMFMALDFVLGVLVAIKNGQLDSKKMFWGGLNKIIVLAFVAVGVRIDMVLNLDDPWCRTAIIYFYIGREGLSLTENYGKLGGVLPKFVIDILSQLKDSNDNPLNGNGSEVDK